MANRLNENLEVGDVVVLAKYALKPEFHALDKRTARVLGGFGMKSHTMGTALFIEFLSDGEKTRWHADDIDAKATRALWERGGRKVEPGPEELRNLL